MTEKLWFKTLRRLHRRYRRAVRCYCQEHTDEADWLMERIVWIESHRPEARTR